MIYRTTIFSSKQRILRPNPRLLVPAAPSKRLLNSGGARTVYRTQLAGMRNSSGKRQNDKALRGLAVWVQPLVPPSLRELI
jgi:hypothetical protein